MKVCLLAAVLALAVAPAAGAAAMTERALRAYETATLGPEHAAEHAVERRAARTALRFWRRMTPAQRRAYRRRLHRADVRATAALAAPLDETGRWDPATIPLPTFAINAVLLPTGRVAFWGRPPIGADGKRLNQSQFFVWDPVTTDMHEYDAPEVQAEDNDGNEITVPAPLFCSAQALLADGELFVAGGNLANPRPGTDFAGLKTTFTFDPWTLTWTRQPDMRHGRWYPTEVKLPDGRVAIFGGQDESGLAIRNHEAEVFTPAATRGGVGRIDYKPGADLNSGLYPHIFTVRGGKLVLGGPEVPDSGVFDLAGLDAPYRPDNWGSVPPLGIERIGGNAVLWPQGVAHDMRVTLIGGFNRATGDATAGTETLDALQADAGWQANGDGIPALNVSRSYGNVVQLPDSSLVAVGGGAGRRAGQGDLNYVGTGPPAEERKQVELLRPAVDAHWRLGPPQQKWRAYHSTAMLLPDGRVLSAGDDYWGLAGPQPGGGDPMDVGEIYSPPYLFDGDHLAPRPAIAGAPAGLPYGVPFAAATSGPDAARAVLVAPAATTHGNDMNQRVVDLGTVAAVPGRGLIVRSPAGPDVAPPGYYMLFVLDARGTPSVAHWVHVAADAPVPSAQLPPLPPGGAVTPAPTPTPARDRTPPRIGLKLARSGRRPRLRVTLGEPGRATVTARAGRRRIVRALRFRKRGAGHSLVVHAPRAATRLSVSVRARDAAGNRSRLSRTWRLERPR